MIESNEINSSDISKMNRFSGTVSVTYFCYLTNSTAINGQK